LEAIQNERNLTAETYTKNRDFIFLKADKKHYKVNLTDILYFESLGDYVIAYTSERKIVTKERISNLAENLPDQLFMQIHRGFIVSVDKIESVGPGYIEINKKKLPVGRNYKTQLNILMRKP
jgi:DNA-binding LytR/AlgR family response regulator